MSETGNIEALAKLVSQDIFKWFKWDTCGLKDTDWRCVTTSHKKRTHPADVVFYYDDPYSGKVIYLNTDLKSYKKGSITATSISKALSSLSISVECANVSEDWQDKYLVNDIGFDSVIGMLFIYNHDDEFDKDLPVLAILLTATNKRFLICSNQLLTTLPRLCMAGNDKGNFSTHLIVVVE
ncbi:hypothetical protein [Aequoribacter sp.]|uniref:hypothetical protein n=1 Tax=Aequoribacter sp. TaxID=2847771 RepID=UPI003C42805B